MEKTYTIAGRATLNGVTKLRFANGTIEARTKVLTRNGATDIQFLELPTPLTKEEAIGYLSYNGIAVDEVKEKEEEIA